LRKALSIPTIKILATVSILCTLSKKSPYFADLAVSNKASNHRDAWGTLEEQGLASLDPRELKLLWT
jgi:hypothetical protein